MDYGERLNGGESGGFTPDMLPRPELSLSEKTNIDRNLGKVNSAAGELIPEIPTPEMNNAPQMNNEEAQLGEITDEPFVRPITEEVLLSTETGSIPDKDGVEKDVEEQVEQIQKNPDLGKRSMEYALARRQFMVGRYADRSYMREEGAK